MTPEEIYQSVVDIPGWMGREDCYVLTKYASKIKKGQILEIGTYAGRSAKVLALSSPTSNVITIDSKKMGDMEDVINKSIVSLNITFIETDSNDFGKEWEIPIDLLFIDGGHTLKQVRNDIESFVHHVKKGGYVLFHDYVVNELGYGVKKAVDTAKCFKSVWVEGGIAVCQV
jgi:predicted O-methyltransferase YrrM